MSKHTLPIVPHVLYVADQNHPWRLAPIERLAVRYSTPTTVAIEFGTVDYTVQPQAGRKVAVKQQYHVWCVPDDAAWERAQVCRQAYQQALDCFADELRRLGGYAKRLEEAGGLKKAPNPLCPTVIVVDDPDSTDTHYFISNPVPQIRRETVASHTPKMLHITRDGKPWSTTHQRDHFVCPGDDHWQMIEQRQKDALATYEAWQRLLRELGTYQDALADGRYAAIQATAAVAAATAQVDRVLALAADRAPVVQGVAMMDAAEARATLDDMRADLGQADLALVSFRRLALDFAEREGWRALGYTSSAAAINAELGEQYSKSYVSRLLNAARIERLLELPMGNSEVPERTLRPLGQLDTPAQQQQAWQAASAAAGGATPTAGQVQAAVDQVKPPPIGPSIADGQHIKQIKQILRTLDQWSPREHPRLLQDAYGHARQITDTESYEALMAEIDRAVEGRASAMAAEAKYQPPQPEQRGHPSAARIVPMPPADEWRAICARADAIGLVAKYIPDRGFSLGNSGGGVSDISELGSLVRLLTHRERAHAEAEAENERRRQRTTPTDVPEFASVYDEMHWRIDRRDWDGAQALIDSLPGGAVAVRKQLAAQLERAHSQTVEAAPSAAWWNVGEPLRAVQRAIDHTNRNDAIAAAQQLLQALLYTSRLARPRKPVSADVSAQTRYLIDLERYALDLEVRLGFAQSPERATPAATPAPPAPRILGDIPDDSPLAPIQEALIALNAWLGISAPHADDEEVAANLAEIAALRHALEVEADNPAIQLDQWELLSRVIGELTRAIEELCEKAVAA